MSTTPEAHGTSAGQNPADRADISEEKRKSIWKVFCGKRCLCGGNKKPGMAFCGPCYFLLPKAMKDELWKRFGEGFEEGYEAAARWLTNGD